LKRFFVAQPLGKDFELQGQEHNHLANVLRTQTGESIIVCNGDEFDYTYNVVKIAKHSTQMKFLNRAINTANPTKHVAVFLALIKPDKLSQAVTQLNEIGVTELVLFNADRCNVVLRTLNLDKFAEIARQSCKQCGRSKPLTIRYTSAEPDVALAPYNTIYFADEMTAHDCVLKSCGSQRDKSINGLPSSVAHLKTQSCAVIIGPEGGFTPNERAKLLKLATPISLGSRILRAETAAVIATILCGGTL